MMTQPESDPTIDTRRLLHYVMSWYTIYVCQKHRRENMSCLITTLRVSLS
jgi:hypothetical protein